MNHDTDQPTEPEPKPDCRCDLCEQRRKDLELAELLHRLDQAKELPREQLKLLKDAAGTITTP